LLIVSLLPGRVSLGGERRTLTELTDQVYLFEGDVAGKVSRFAILLILAAVIATAGVLSDSTATVIGAMIIAPLATPIVGIAAGIVEGNARHTLSSLAFVLGGAVVVVGIGALLAVIVPSLIPTLSNSQISGRTSPGLVDLLAAVATGTAGAFAMARKDISDVLPGVAIAISLVPPLAVVGITAAHGQGSLALGALLLFASNVVAIVLTGTLVFSAYGYVRDARRSAEAAGVGTFRRAHANLVVALTVAAVTIPLAVNTIYGVIVNRWLDQSRAAASAWVRSDPGTQLLDVTLQGDDTYIFTIQGPGTGPSPSGLVSRLSGALPGGTHVVVDHVNGTTVNAGTVS
jgi:uncharacterized hydrophobic protein (TIGR00271 family)